MSAANNPANVPISKVVPANVPIANLTLPAPVRVSSGPIIMTGGGGGNYQPILANTTTGSDLPNVFTQGTLTGDIVHFDPVTIAHAGHYGNASQGGYTVSDGFEVQGYVFQSGFEASHDQDAYTSCATMSSYMYEPATQPRQMAASISTQATGDILLDAYSPTGAVYRINYNAGGLTVDVPYEGEGGTVTRLSYTTTGSDYTQRPALRIGKATFPDFKREVVSVAGTFSAQMENMLYLVTATGTINATLQDGDTGTMCSIVINSATATVTITGSTAVEIKGSTSLTKTGVGNGWRITKIPNSAGKTTFFAEDILSKTSILTRAESDARYTPISNGTTYANWVTVKPASPQQTAFKGEMLKDVENVPGLSGKKANFLHGTVHNSGGGANIPFSYISGMTTDKNGAVELDSSRLLQADYREIGLYNKVYQNSADYTISSVEVRSGYAKLRSTDTGGAACLTLTPGGAIYEPPVAPSITGTSVLNKSQMDALYAPKTALLSKADTVTGYTGNITIGKQKLVIKNGIIDSII